MSGYSLKYDYTKVCDLYVLAFLRKHNLWDDERNIPFDSEWVGGDAGGILEVLDYYIGFNEIRIDIDNDIDKEIFFEYYHYTTDSGKGINYESYLKGAR